MANLLLRVAVDQSEVEFEFEFEFEFELKYLPRQATKNQLHSHLFSYAKNHDPAWPDPNAELMEAVQKRGAKVISREA